MWCLLAVGVLGVLVVATLRLCNMPVCGVTAHMNYVSRTAYRLEHQTDHDELLRECRFVLRTRERFRKYVANPQETDIELRSSDEIAALPESLRKLHPSAVVIGTNNVLLIFAGGHVHLGVRAYAEGSRGYGYELVPGLYMLGD